MGHDLIKICSAHSNPEADIIKATLVEHNIHAFVQGYHHRGMMGSFGAFVELNILVPANQAKEAREILQVVLGDIELPEPEEIREKVKTRETKKAGPKALRPRSARVAFILPFFLPGMGNLYAGRRKLGGSIMGITAICLAFIFLEFPLEAPHIAPILFIVIFILLIFDALTSSFSIRRKNEFPLLFGLLAGLAFGSPLFAQEVVLKGRVTDAVWATVTIPPKGKAVEYIELEEGRRIVAYVTGGIRCAGPVLLQGKLIPVRVESEKGSKLEGEVFTDEHLDVSSWKCLGSELSTWIHQLGDFRLSMEQKRELKRKIIDEGQEAIPILISHLGDRRIYERNRDIQNYYSLPPLGKMPPPLYANITVGEICDEILYEIVTPSSSSPQNIKPYSFQILSVPDWKLWWEKNKAKSLRQIHKELKPLVDRYWKEHGTTQVVY